MCQHAAKGWLQRLVRLYRLLVRESHRAIWGVIYFGSNCEATLMIGRIQREGFDLAGIYFTNAEGMRAGCGRNERDRVTNFFHPPEAAHGHRSKSGGADLVFGVASQVVAV